MVGFRVAFRLGLVLGLLVLGCWLRMMALRILYFQEVRGFGRVGFDS